MLLNGGRSCCERRKEARTSRHRADFDHVLGNQNVHVYQVSFGNKHKAVWSRQGTKFMAVLGGKC